MAAAGEYFVHRQLLFRCFPEGSGTTGTFNFFQPTG